MANNIPNIVKNSFLKSQMLSDMDEITPATLLTDNEEKFCQLFCHGGTEYAGNATKCYAEVYQPNEKGSKIVMKANQLLTNPSVNQRINELMTKKIEDATFLKMRVLETLTSIMEETRTSTYKDRFGVTLSPAPLRAVSVNAAREIGNILGWKKGQEDKSKINIEGGSNVTFNVVVPKS